MPVDLTALDENPPPLPANVARVTLDGMPSKELLDWEHYQRNWAIDLAKAANANSETLSSWGIDVEDSVGDATAQGRIRFDAASATGYSTARFQLEVRATTADSFSEAGMEILADTGSGSRIAFIADQFRFVDTGTDLPVLEYNGATFNFGVPVTVLNQDIGANAVTNQEFAFANPNASGTAGDANVEIVNFTLRENARVLITVGIYDTFDAIDLAVAATGHSETLSIRVNNVEIDTMWVPFLHFAHTKSGGLVDELWAAPCPVAKQLQHQVGAAGDYDFKLVNEVNSGVFGALLMNIGMYISVVELADN